MQRHPAHHDINQHLATFLGQGLILDTWQPITGGSIHQAWAVTSLCGKKFFIKTNQAHKKYTLEVEALGLRELNKYTHAKNPLRIPKVYTYGNNKTYAWLILEHIEFGHSNKTSQEALGLGLALLHKNTSAQFGLQVDNVIGESLQTNTFTDTWLDFYTNQRLGTQLHLAKDHGFYSRIATESEQLLEILPSLLLNHNPPPSLLHGDLWGGNVGCDVDGHPLIYDPAVYYGDRECDLAMTELFGGFFPLFYAAYNHVYPLEQGYTARKNLYNLYHILNHANLFGGSYIVQSQHMMQQLIRQIP